MLYELQEQIKLLNIRRQSLIDQIEMLGYRMENIGAIKFDKIAVLGHGTPITIDDIVEKKYACEQEVKMIDEHLPILTRELKCVQDTLSEFNERDIQIYEHAKIKGWTSVKIGIKFGLSSGRIRDIVSNIDKSSLKYKMLFEGCDK